MKIKANQTKAGDAWMQTKTKDVVVVGGGVVGTSILRKLSYYQLDIALIEKQPDLCEGASKANSGT